MTPCLAVQHSDMMSCGRCGLGWDTGDPDRPPCAAQAAPYPDGNRVPAIYRRDRNEQIDAARGVTWRKP